MHIKLLDQETTLTSATNLANATLVRVYNTGSAATVTHKNSSGSTIGTVTLAAGEIVLLQKAATDTLEGGSAFKSVKVAFAN
jgi:hypothetical protein